MANISPDENRQHLNCNLCGLLTWHDLIFVHSVSHTVYSGEEMEPIDEITEKWEILQCRGCDNVSIRQTTKSPWEEELKYEFYPERTGDHHHEKKYQKLPRNLHELYSEVVSARNRNTLLLCSAGLRALLEGLCDDKGITKGPNEKGRITRNLEGRINGLASIVPSGIVKNLHGLRFLGNQALHELEIPNRDDLDLALTVIEDILNVVYDLNYKSQLLYEKVTHPRSIATKTLDDSVPF
jgi:hypothetical protein